MGILGFRNVYRRVPVGLRGQIVEALSNLPQQTSSSLLYTLRAPLRYWIATTMDIIEPQRPDSGQHVGIEGDCRGRSGTIVINEYREEKDNKINKHEHAVAPCFVDAAREVVRDTRMSSISMHSFFL